MPVEDSKILVSCLNWNGSCLEDGHGDLTSKVERGCDYELGIKR